MKPDWLHILEAQLASAPRGSNGTTPPEPLTPVYAFSTVSNDSSDDAPKPQVRHVVHRAATPSSLLLATTDLRSAKATQLADNPAAEAAWWFPTSSVQFRISGKAYVLPATHEENERSVARSRSPSVHSIAAVKPEVHVSEPESAPQTDIDSLTLRLETTNIDRESREVPSPLSPLSHISTLRSPLSRGASTDSSPDHSASSPATLSRTPSLSAPKDRLSRSSSLARSASRSRTNKNRPVLRALEDSLVDIRALVPSTAPESSPSWWTAERKRLWEGMAPAMRASFARPTPGTNLNFSDEGETWPKELGKHAHDDEESRTHAFALGNFALLALAPERVEVLELAVVPHRRTVWVCARTDGAVAVWEKEEVVP